MPEKPLLLLCFEHFLNTAWLFYRGFLFSLKALSFLCLMKKRREGRVEAEGSTVWCSLMTNETADSHCPLLRGSVLSSFQNIPKTENETLDASVFALRLLLENSKSFFFLFSPPKKQDEKFRSHIIWLPSFSFYGWFQSAVALDISAARETGWWWPLKEIVSCRLYRNAVLNSDWLTAAAVSVHISRPLTYKWPKWQHRQSKSRLCHLSLI